jgi:hypothetical protein
MNLSFLPGDLHLSEGSDGSYLVSLGGSEVLRTRSEKKALSTYNRLRREMESQFPTRDLPSEVKARLLEKYIGDSLVPHNGSRPQKKGIKPGSTRTFG